MAFSLLVFRFCPFFGSQSRFARLEFKYGRQPFQRDRPVTALPALQDPEICYNPTSVINEAKRQISAIRSCNKCSGSGSAW